MGRALVFRALCEGRGCSRDHRVNVVRDLKSPASGVDYERDRPFRVRCEGQGLLTENPGRRRRSAAIVNCRGLPRKRARPGRAPRFEELAMTFTMAQLTANRQGEQYALHKRFINPSLARVQAIIGFDKTYTRGEGSYLWDAGGTRYLDLLSGFGVFNLGRSHPFVKQAIQEVLALDRPNLIKMDCPLLAGLLAEELVKGMPPGLDAIFFGNSGADAVDTALKFARAATKRPRMLYLDHAFHGLTLGTLALNGGKEFRKGFEPLMAGFDAVAMNDLVALEKQLRREDVAAFIVEPIQGKGVYIPADGYLPEAQRLCRKY